jgi:hypothetical protein
MRLAQFLLGLSVPCFDFSTRLVSRYRYRYPNALHLARLQQSTESRPNPHNKQDTTRMFNKTVQHMPMPAPTVSLCTVHIHRLPFSGAPSAPC